MKPLKNKEKLVRDLVNTFNDRDELHEAYKKKMKEIFSDLISVYLECRSDAECSKISLTDFIDAYIETRFKPRDE